MKLYSTPTCKYCATLKQALDSMDVEYEEINLWEDKEAQTRVSSVPTLLLEFPEGPPISYVGWTSKKHLQEFLDNHVGSI